MGGSDYTFDSTQEAMRLIPRDEYQPIMRNALVRLPELDSQPQDLVQMLFNKEELEWLKQNLRAT